MYPNICFLIGCCWWRISFCVLLDVSIYLKLAGLYTHTPNQTMSTSTKMYSPWRSRDTSPPDRSVPSFPIPTINSPWSQSKQRIVVFFLFHVPSRLVLTPVQNKNNNNAVTKTNARYQGRKGLIIKRNKNVSSPIVLLQYCQNRNW